MSEATHSAEATMDATEAPWRAMATAVRELGGTLRERMPLPFDVPMDTFESWARHLEGFRPSPRAEAPSGRRDLEGAEAFVREVCRLHQTGVAMALSELRQVVWSFTETLGRAVVENTEADHRAMERLDRLRDAVVSNSIAQIKDAALSTVQELTDLIEARRSRDRFQAEQLGRRVQQLRSALAEARREGHLDALTGLRNRRAFDAELAVAYERAHLLGEPSVLILFDLDHFKRINDGFGHLAGDDVLRVFARTLASTFPRRNDTVARYGGEEFAVILRHAQTEDGTRLAERLCQTTRVLEVATDRGAVRPTVSAGVAPADGSESVAEWVDRADRALYAAKLAGRDRVVLAR